MLTLVYSQQYVVRAMLQHLSTKCSGCVGSSWISQIAVCNDDLKELIRRGILDLRADVDFESLCHT